MKPEIINAMQCDPVTGLCNIPNIEENKATSAISKPVKLLFFTDPICSSCWGMEAQMRKLQLEYGQYFDVEYRMGGLLKSWDSYGGSDVNGPASVAQHWDEAGTYYNMPIDGDVWKEDPLASSYPPSIAFKAAQLQDGNKANLFLRKLKEMLFVEKKNITRWEHLSAAALETGLDVIQFKKDFEQNGEALFQQDLDVAKQYGVRGFPTIFFIDNDDNQFKVYGSKPYEQYEQALLKLLPNAVKNSIPATTESIFERYDSVTTKEFALLRNKSMAEANTILEDLHQQQKLNKLEVKNGILWRKTDLIF